MKVILNRDTVAVFTALWVYFPVILCTLLCKRC